MKNFTGIFQGLIIGMKDLGQWGVDEGHLDVSKLRFTIGARQEEAKRLVDGGMSERVAAKTLGVDRSTVRRDLGRMKQGGSNRPENGSNSSAEEDPDLPDQKVLRARYQRALLSDALGAIAEMSRKTRKEFFIQLKEKYGGFDT